MDGFPPQARRLAELTNHIADDAQQGVACYTVEEQEEYRRLSEVVVGWVIEHTQCG